MNEIRKKQYEMEVYADLLERIMSSENWYRHTDEETGELVDDTDENSILHLAAYRAAKKAILKLAGC